MILAVLWWSDRALRREAKLDEQVLRGHTGLSWFDDLLARRAAQQADLKKLEETLAAAGTVEKRIEANYAIIKFETGCHRPESRRARKALCAITDEGKALPQTVEAWRELIRIALAREESSEQRKRLFDNYAMAVNNLPHNPFQLNRLLELWTLSTQNKLESLEFLTLQKIHHDFPIAPEALSAYEALVQHDSLQNDRGRLAAVEDSIRQTRDLLLRQGEELDLANKFEKHRKSKNAAEAEKVLFAMTPGLVSSINYWALHQQAVSLYESQKKIARIEDFLLKTVAQWKIETLKDDQRTILLTTIALLQSEKRRNKESRATLAKAPQAEDLKENLKNWRNHLQSRLDWAAATNAFSVTTASVPTSAGAGSGAATAPDRFSSIPWIPMDPANTSTNMPSTRWKAINQGNHLFLRIECSEPSPDKIVARHDRPDSNVWEDDCIEIFATPLHTDAFYSQVIVNSRGVLCDIRYTREKTMVPCKYAADIKWSSKVTLSTTKTKTGWRTDVSIPWRSLEIQPSEKACFFNLRRQRYVTGKMEIFSWSSVPPKQHDPSTMGLLLLKSFTNDSL